ncbi:MAG: hypothetical protein QGH45_24055 [Myxococcota bacterium]|nr:hypothetical protein [Myxococcota bacterium]
MGQRDESQSIGLHFTVAATALSALCALLLIAGLMDRITSNPDPDSVPDADLVDDAQSTGKPIAAFFNSSVDELFKVARRNGDDPEEVLPDDLELQQALNSRDFRSVASQRVLSKLRDGYTRYGMSFPGTDLIRPMAPPTQPPR